MQYTGLANKSPVLRTIEKTCQSIRRQQHLRNTNIESLSKEKDREEWSGICCGEESITGQKELGRIAAFQEWKDSWPHRHYNVNPRRRAIADPVEWKAANHYTDKEGKKKMNLRGTPVSNHRNLKRAQSSVAIQIRSEHIGLKSYLYRRRVPGFDSPQYQCGYLSENVKHAIMACPLKARGRAEVWRRAKNRSFEAMMNNPEDIARIT
ncbi:hypothetical protein K3495_g2368 [Podosphaera aphanis]|nr:hypothetical protein K3495_g2368 [Podosphaera aphanis]